MLRLLLPGAEPFIFGGDAGESCWRTGEIAASSFSLLRTRNSGMNWLI